MAEVIDTADHVKHSPTGETWVVGYVRGDKLAACGWPDTLANLSDCTLVKKATGPERLSLLQELARSSGHRASYARERLAASGVSAVGSQPSSSHTTGKGRGTEGISFDPAQGPEVTER